MIKYNAHSAEGKLVIPPGGDTSPPPGRRKLFVSPTHIFIHLPIYFYQDWSDTYFCYNNILSLFILLLLMFHLWPLGALSGWLWCPFGMPHVIVFFLFSLAIPCFLSFLDPLGSSCISCPRPRMRHFPQGAIRPVLNVARKWNMPNQFIFHRVSFLWNGFLGKHLGCRKIPHSGTWFVFPYFQWRPHSDFNACLSTSAFMFSH